MLVTTSSPEIFKLSLSIVSIKVSVDLGSGSGSVSTAFLNSTIGVALLSESYFAFNHLMYSFASCSHSLPVTCRALAAKPSFALLPNLCAPSPNFFAPSFAPSFALLPNLCAPLPKSVAASFAPLPNFCAPSFAFSAPSRAFPATVT